MKLIAGLGNPGSKYAMTRHNVGFMVADLLAERHGINIGKEKKRSETGKGMIGGTPIVITKPLTFMNLSGEAIAPLAAYLDIGVEDIIVIHDDLDLEFGRIKIKAGGGHGGHNGLKSLISHLNGREFTRIRMGIGKPVAGGDVSSYVLSQFSAEEKKELINLIEHAADAVENIISKGADRAMNSFN
ncbi:MAG: aminoacyl-tRNA hydrolase [Proteobacteria bacterium]|nr:aminoacyl-tRNA hydrolase [Pseudomonadota bacterium]